MANPVLLGTAKQNLNPPNIEINLTQKVVKASNGEIIPIDNYFDVVDAYLIAGEAARKYPDSFAVSMICNLIKAQGLTAYEEYCYSSKMFLSLKDNPKLKLDMKKFINLITITYSEKLIHLRLKILLCLIITLSINTII